MRKVALIVLLLVTVMTVQAQGKEFESCPLDVIDKGWPTKTIDNVINGSLGIMFESFNRTWPTWMGGAICETMEQGLAKRVLDEETSLVVTVDTKNGYVEIDDGGTDGAYMSACVWNRSNGHKLFAVRIGKPTDPCLEFVCFYDYDAQKKTLTPEPDILKGYRWSDKKTFTQIFYHLPKTGKTLLVDEWGDNGPVQHTFNWDGMKPVYAKTAPLEFNDGGNIEIPVNFKGSTPNIKDFVTALLSGEDSDESLNGLKMSWDLFLNGMKQMPGDDIMVDVQNGYMGYESVDTDSEPKNRLVIECCYWNYADKRHKLVAISNDLFIDGKAVAGQYTGIEFYIYDNATHKMKHVYWTDFGPDIDTPPGAQAVSHSLPRQGKTIVYSYPIPSGKIEKRFTWNGTKFMLETK